MLCKILGGDKPANRSILVRASQGVGGLATKRETVNEALKEFVQNRLRRQLLELRRQIEYFEDYDYKALRRLKHS